jgi:glutamate synthase domain-containing protein 2
MVIGENVMVSFGDKALKDRIENYKKNFDGKHGAIIVQGNVEERKHGVFEKGVSFGADAVEIKLGQGSKQGLGGEIKFEEEEKARYYKEMGFTVLKSPDGLFQRHASPGTISMETLKEDLLKCKKFNVPVWIKVAIGKDILVLLKWLEELKKKEKIPIEVVTVDGFGGGTGMSPWYIMNESNIPSAALLSLKRIFSFDLVLAGGYCDGMDVSKALMLGARAVAMGRAFLIASKIGKEDGIKNYCEALKEELQMVCATQRVKQVKELIGRRENLFPLTQEAAALFGIPFNVESLLGK